MQRKLSSKVVVPISKISKVDLLKSACTICLRCAMVTKNVISLFHSKTILARNILTFNMFTKLKNPKTGEMCIFSSSVSQKDVDDTLRYEAQPRDIFICSFAKCGTTWLQNIVWLILHEGQEMTGRLRQNIPMLEMDGSDYTKKIDDTHFPKIVKTHYRASWVPYNPKTKYLYITRNPKDAMVSFYYHCKGFPQYYGPDMLDFDKLFDLYVKGEVSMNGYFEHVTEWYLKRDDPNVLFLVYEDLKVDPKGEILKVAKFLGDEYFENMKKDGDKLLKVVAEKSSFEQMKGSSVIWVRRMYISYRHSLKATFFADKRQT